MADFSQNISNSVNVFGNEKSTIWGQGEYPYTMTWGTTKWGEGSYTILCNIEHLVAIGSTSLTWEQTRLETEKLISETLTPAFETSSETLQNGIWYYVFSGGTTEAENRINTSYTSGATTTASYTCLTAQSTTWT